MKDDKFSEHPLDSLLDNEPEEEFGDPETRDHLHHHADERSRANLKDWSAQDFASIYVRFRPHLERHARRYLANPIQAEEVVQDAFLYLMTTLPEMDSELGVLKFLKWKIRLLSFDILRSASTRRETPLLEYADYESDDPEFTADLERAEDNAVIRMALARLNPRQREALVASVYEEKTSEEVAQQLGLSANATRQLLFRARSAFRKALVGEAEIQGKSISQVLTIAAKKAALEVREHGTKVGAFLVLAAVGLGVLPSLVSSPETVVAEAPVVEYPAADDQATTDQEPAVPSGPAESNDRAEPFESVDDDFVAPEAEAEVFEETATVPSTPQTVDPIIVPPLEQRLTNQTLGTILATDVSNAGFYTGSYAAPFASVFEGVSVEVFGGTGISAFLDLDTESKTVDLVLFQMRVDGEDYFGVASSTDMETSNSGNGYTISIVCEEFYVVDEQRNVFSESPLADSKAVVTLELAGNGTPQSASMKVESLK